MQNPLELLKQEQMRIKTRIEVLSKGTLILFPSQQKAQQIASRLGQKWDGCNGVFIEKQDIELILEELNAIAGEYLENFCLVGTFYDLVQHSMKLTFRRF